MLLRIRLASLMGCPIWQVGQIIPASEIPLWQAFYAREPWGFRAEDMLSSKNTKYLMESFAKLEHGVTYEDLMFHDRFEAMELTEKEFNELSDEEQSVYIDNQIRKTQMVLN